MFSIEIFKLKFKNPLTSNYQCINKKKDFEI